MPFCVEFLDDGNVLLKTNDEKQITVNYAVYKRPQLLEPKYALSPDGKIFVIESYSLYPGKDISRKKSFKILLTFWNAINGELIIEYIPTYLIKEDLTIISFSPDGKFIVYITENGDLYLLNITTFELQHKEYSVDIISSELFRIIWSQNNERFAVYSAVYSFTDNCRLTILNINYSNCYTKSHDDVCKLIYPSRLNQKFTSFAFIPNTNNIAVSFNNPIEIHIYSFEKSAEASQFASSISPYVPPAKWAISKFFNSMAFYQISSTISIIALGCKDNCVYYGQFDSKSFSIIDEITKIKCRHVKDVSFTHNGQLIMKKYNGDIKTSTIHQVIKKINVLLCMLTTCQLGRRRFPELPPTKRLPDEIWDIVNEFL